MDIIKLADEDAGQYAKYVVELYEKRNGKTVPAEEALKRLEKDVSYLTKNKIKDKILLCLKTDPYPTDYECNTITKGAIEILDKNKLEYVIVTDKIMRAISDIEQLKRPENVKLVIKIESIPRDKRSIEERYKSHLDHDFETLQRAFKKKIKIQIDLNPAIYPDLLSEFIRKFYAIVYQWKLGEKSFQPKTESKSTWDKFKEDEKEIFYTLGNLSPWTVGDIPIRKGNCNILVIAPHGCKIDDENTGEMAWQIADLIDSYAVINEFYQKPPYKKDKKGKIILNSITGKAEREAANKEKKWVDLNNLDQIKDQLDENEFLKPIKELKDKIVKRFGMAQIFLIHGIKDENMAKEGKRLGVKSNIALLLGAGRDDSNGKQPCKNRSSAGHATITNLIDLLRDKKIIAEEALRRRDCESYAGWDRRNLNQLFTESNDNDPKVQSVQIEIKMTGYRNDAHIPNKAWIFAEAFAKMDNFNAKEIQSSIEDMEITDILVETEPDMAIVDKAYAKISDIFYSHAGNLAFKIGEFIVRNFYNNEIELVKSRSPVKKLSLNQLIKKIQSSHNKQPSRSWIFQAVKLYVETRELETTVQTYGQLQISHKILLLAIRNRDTKIQLIDETIKNKYTVAGLKDRIDKLKAAEKPQIEPSKSLLQVVKNPDLLFSKNYAADRDMKSLLKLKPALLKKIHTRIKEKLKRIEEELNEFQTAVETHKGHLKQYKKFITSVETAKKKFQNK